ncbi:FAD-binding and (Fe-S)-binding domain-containing protein [Niabella yanshanensis]|uniref:D-lactate dehydrogenase (cytochrome) n=1 Tax=Niabella yanshanensis TaxID=577386 RepID=A0ABZ0W713_9BACT|nr:FAD-binding and (Fe-S)-binding domain-containing protein [Niabella yanshanensis]WQD38926.1 FAD-binding and (Fe-S)-binding domain-containing protein [Niabella yanshanensis]
MSLDVMLADIFPSDRIKMNLIDLVAYASDAGFYNLRPRAVVLPVSEEEVIRLFKLAHEQNIPVVFRTGGTSLSGQSVTDGILVDLSQYWRKATVENEGGSIRVQPGVIGAVANVYLKKFGRKIGPDPASINAAMIGGIISNNASGMCCGVSNNSYHTVQYLRFTLPDGKTYSTEVKEDYARFSEECPQLSAQLSAIRQQVLGNEQIYSKIRKKYLTKNTVGYSVNAFIDFAEPLDILAHLLVGAEGTLGFISEAVMQTVPDYPEKATGLLYFPDIYTACQAIVPISDTGAVAIELMDRASLRSVEHVPGLPTIIKDLPEGAAALLVEYGAPSKDYLNESLAGFQQQAGNFSLLEPAAFTSIPQQQALLWKVRKGMFPSVGAVRKSGTTVILEDVAFPVAMLGDAIVDLQSLFRKFGYHQAIIFGHAKDGNIHFVVTQSFNSETEVQRYEQFMAEIVELVVNRYDGALKAEHGTGRNMAPFVETEWGGAIYEIMKTVKNLVDPYNILNPGVIINPDPQAHITHLKELPSVESEVDKCIECGFCEHKCPSRDLTLTPRRRIVVRRELVKLKQEGNADYKKLLDQYKYQGLDTCAVDGLCATVCPVDINTGDLVKRLRKENHAAWNNKLALMTSKNFGVVLKTVKTAVRLGTAVNHTFGANTMTKATRMIRKIAPSFPLWSPQLTGAPSTGSINTTGIDATTKVVYFASCISRVMGDKLHPKASIMERFVNVSHKVGVGVILAGNSGKNCCGQIYSSKGFTEAHSHMVNATISELWAHTNEGAYPVVLDITSCTYTLLNCRSALTDENKLRFDQMRILDSIDYLYEYVLPRAGAVKRKNHIALHPVCSSYKIPGLDDKFRKVAEFFSHKVTIPTFAGCCGMAGDRGFLFPELTRSATALEATDVVDRKLEGCYSSSKTCEIAMSDNTKKNYQSILNLADECLVL